jgi:nitrogen regulatory protein PII
MAESANLKLLFFIIEWDRLKTVSAVFEKEHGDFIFISKGMGTANSEILDLLGIGSTDKAVILRLERGTETARLISTVRRKLGARSSGAGIAFTIPLSAINAPLMQIFSDFYKDGAGAIQHTEVKKEQNMAQLKENEGTGKVEIKNGLIISILNHGYSNEFMAVARNAGARGGTVISARGLSQQKKNFLGISVQDEKEIIIILANRENATAIMQAVSSAYGTASKAGGVIFSLPVDQVMSLNEM